MTSTCPTCGRFLSRGARHDLSSTCRPPDEPLGALRVPTIRTPFHAWPEEHVHHGPAGRTVTSPLPGLGPRLVAVLARHQALTVPAERRTRPFGPAAALRQLLEAGPEAALDKVLHPDPYLLHCIDTWHPVGVEAGTLVLHAHREVDVDSELVAAALTGVRPPGCLHAVDAWRRRRHEEELPSLGQLPVLDAARQWFDAGADLGERDPWIAEGWDPPTVRRAADAGVDEVELLRWRPVTRVPETAAAWQATGWTVREAQELTQRMTPQEAGAWRTCGLDVNRIHEARRGGFDRDAAVAWHRAGWPLLLAGTLVARGCSLPDAEALLRLVGRRADVVSLAVAGICTPGDLRLQCDRRALDVPALVGSLR